jgi:signal transduction histidine kinase
MLRSNHRPDLNSQKATILPQPWRGPFARWPRAADAALAIFVFLWTVFVTDEVPNQDLALRAVTELPIVAILVFAIGSCALYWRRVQPLAVFGVNALAQLLLTLLEYPNSVWALPFALYSVGRYASVDKKSYLVIGAALALILIVEFASSEPATDIGFGLVFVFLIWYAGRSIRIREAYTIERAAQREREHAAEARRAVAEERTRIARELHDIVAHRVSLMTVQAGAAKTVAADDLPRALQAIEAVESAGREALSELRHLLGVLRPASEVDERGPQPGLADIPRLVEHINQAGLSASLDMKGVPSELPAPVNLSAYRIIQEALTNVLKHADDNVVAEVRLKADNNDLVIEVLDNGRGATSLPGAGHGIAGMRERAELMGGRLNAGPRPGGGFQVIAHLPIAQEPN